MPRIFSSFPLPELHWSYVVHKHRLPKIGVLKAELLRDFEAETEVQNDDLVPFSVPWVGTHEDVAGVRIAVNEPRNEDLLSEGADDVVHHSAFVEAVRVHLRGVGDFESVDPFRDHHSARRELLEDGGNVELRAL